MKITLRLTLFISILLFSNCGGPSDTNSSKEKDVTIQNNTEKVWEEFTIRAVGNTMQDMKFSTNNISVKEGSWVRINLINDGTDPSMIHNIIFINYGTRSKLALDAVEVGLDNNFIPRSKDVIAASELAQPGESVTLEFQAPAKGNYEFFCSYPGHASMMRGYFIVKK